MTNDVLILVPTRNEVQNLKPLITKLLYNFPNSVYLFIDDSSTDGTFENLNELSASNKQIQVISRFGKEPNIASSYLLGYKFAQEKGFKYVGQMDCDGQHDVIDLKKIYDEKEHFDIVIGSRYVLNGKVIGWSRSRLLLSRVANFYLKVLFPSIPISDITSGIRLSKISALDKMWNKSPKSKGFSFHAESTLIAHRLRFEIAEKPITFSPRSSGKSKMNLKRALESTYKFFIWRFRL